MSEKYKWLDEFLCARPGAEKVYQVEWNAYKYMLRGKMFAMVGGDKEEKPIVTLKLEPLNGERMRGEYPDIIPGYYMNKQHWNSVYLEGQVPRQAIQEMILESHRLILGSLSKKVQSEITATA